MDLLNKLTWKNLKLNKKRTIVTVIGIMLSVALITAVASMFFSARTSLIKYQVEQKGDYHYSFFDVPKEEAEALEEHRKIEKIYCTNQVGYALLDGIQMENEYKPYVYVQAYDQEAMENLGLRLTEGRLPENANEILISQHLYTNGNVKLNVGDTITLEVGRRMLDGYELNQTNPYEPGSGEEIVDTETTEYTIVGEIERLSYGIEPHSAPGYTFITCLTEENASENVDVYIRYSKEGLKEHGQLTARILEVDEEDFCTFIDDAAFYRLSEAEQTEIRSEVADSKYEYTYNEYLVVLETGVVGESSLQALALAAGVVMVIIIVTSVFCIRNSFDISITEKIRQYGMLSSIGATKRQIRKNVYYEAFLLGLAGIPLGILAGNVAAVILVHVSNYFLRDSLNLTLVFDLSWMAVFFAAVLGVVTIFFSARKSAVKASKISPIQAIRNSGDIKISASKVRCPGWVSRIFGIGGEISYKNLKRSRKKYRTTVASIIICVTVFIVLYSFINLAFGVIENEFENARYSLNVTYQTDGTDSYVEDVEKLDHINEMTSMIPATTILTEAPFSREYENYLKSINSDIYGEEDLTGGETGLWTFILDEEDFRAYVESLHLNYEKVREKGILLNQVDLFYYPDGGEDYVETRVSQYDWKAGDTIKGYMNVEDKETGAYRQEEIQIEIAALADERPMGVPQTTSEAFFIVGEEYEKKLDGSEYFRYIYIDSSNAAENRKDIEAMFAACEGDWSINDVSDNARMMKSLYTLIAIFLYGFIIVIALIGVTNIFNTITTNMNLRRREFAMLKSVGMTDREFRRMVSLESFFYGMRSLLIGVPLGTILSYVVYKVMMSGNLILPYQLPIGGIVISVVAVFLLITVIMRYSIRRINEENVIETIRNENI